MNKTFGFIGTGNMGSALARAAVKAMEPTLITLADQCEEKCNKSFKHLRPPSSVRRSS